MASIREQIIDFVEAKLGEAGGPTGLRVHRSRHRPIDAADETLPAVVIYPIDEDVELASHDRDVKRSLMLRFECRVQGEPTDTQLDPILTWVVQQMFDVPKLGGLAIWVREQKTQWAGESRERTLGAAAVDFEIAYETMQNDPEVQP